MYIAEWCTNEKRSFLRHRIETRQADLLFRLERYNDALELLKRLLHEIKKLDDKALQVEIQLIESQVFHALENIPKSKASLTAVKTASHSIYVAPQTQACVDMMSGVISAEENDYITAYSYFYESFEGYNSLSDPLAEKALKYMCLSKIMNKQSDDALNVINSQISLKYQGVELESMREVAKAAKAQNLLLFEKCKNSYEKGRLIV